VRTGFVCGGRVAGSAGLKPEWRRAARRPVATSESSPAVDEGNYGRASIRFLDDVALALAGYGVVKSLRAARSAQTLLRAERTILGVEALATTINVAEVGNAVLSGQDVGFWEGFEVFVRALGLGLGSLSVKRLRELADESATQLLEYAPFAVVERLSDDLSYCQLTESPADYVNDYEAFHMRQKAVKNHLGLEYFRGSRGADRARVVPDFFGEDKIGRAAQEA
jgi:hypothetical protein